MANSSDDVVASLDLGFLRSSGPRGTVKVARLMKSAKTQVLGVGG